MKYVTKYVVFIFSISFFDNLVGISQLQRPNPAGIYLFKVNKVTLEPCVKSIQSW